MPSLIQDQFEDEMQTFLGGEDCPVFNNLYQYCQVINWNPYFVQLYKSVISFHSL